MDPQTRRHAIKEMMIDELMLEMTPDEISDETPIFGADGLGLDSVDALQLVVALDKHFGLKLGDSDEARAVLESVGRIAEEIEKSAS